MKEELIKEEGTILCVTFDFGVYAPRKYQYVYWLDGRKFVITLSKDNYCYQLYDVETGVGAIKDSEVAGLKRTAENIIGVFKKKLASQGIGPNELVARYKNIDEKIHNKINVCVESLLM